MKKFRKRRIVLPLIALLLVAVLSPSEPYGVNGGFGTARYGFPEERDHRDRHSRLCGYRKIIKEPLI